MREILFRGKCSGGWIEGCLIHTGNYVCILQDESKVHPMDWPYLDDELGVFDGKAEPVDPETVGQFTGLTVNGTKIFEGDILKFSYTGKNHGVEGTEAVVFKNGKFGVEWGWHRELVALDGFANTTMEVIGNIPDNPELIRGAHND